MKWLEEKIVEPKKIKIDTDYYKKIIIENEKMKEILQEIEHFCRSDEWQKAYKKRSCRMEILKRMEKIRK